MLKRIDRERAKEGVRTGETPNRSKWIRRAIKSELESMEVESAETAEV